MKLKLQKNKSFFVFFFFFSFFSFFSIAKPAETFNYSSFLPTANNSNYFNASAYYNPADFSGQKFPLITEDIPCVDINYNIGPGNRDYVVFGPILKLQMFLYQNEYMIYPPTGLYLHYTYDGVRNFQRENGLRETGILDLNTRKAVKQATCETKKGNFAPVINSGVNHYPYSNQYAYQDLSQFSNQIQNQISYYCPLNNTYYNSQSALTSNCINNINNNQTTYTLNYNTNGADSGAPNLSSQTVTAGTAITLPDQGSMIKSGYTFSGWSTSQSGSSLSSPFTPAYNATLYAIWISNSVIGSGGSGNGNTGGGSGGIGTGSGYNGITGGNGGTGYGLGTGNGDAGHNGINGNMNIIYSNPTNQQ